MKGKHSIVVRNRRVQFALELERNITVIRGDSATGKTTMLGMLRDYEELGACLLYTSPSPRDRTRSRMPSSA